MNRERFNTSNRKEKRNLSPEQMTPIDKKKEEVIDFLCTDESSVLVAHTGAGKTSRVPVLLFEALVKNLGAFVKELGRKPRIAVTVPRRNIAVSVPEYIAGVNGYTMGKEIGFQIRFEDHTDPDTNINFMTDGIMLRKIINDPLLKEYDAVMVDEAHERSLNIDLTLGLLKESQRRRKEEGYRPLKVVVSSATIEKEKFAAYFGTEAVMEVEGKMFPVEEHYAERWEKNYTAAAAEKCDEIISSGEPGDILVFMPGQGEIFETIRYLNSKKISDQCEVLALHASISRDEQNRIITKRGDKRRIIVSTNIAEAGVTVDGVRHVVDSGLIKETGFDPKLHIRRLETKEHSQAGLRQRRGRAGRITDGTYHALYTRESFERRPPYSIPEIQRTDLPNLVLIMKKIGINDVHSFDFIDRPDSEQIDFAVRELKTLGALDERGNITSVGETMADLPLEPRIARMVVEGIKNKCVGDIVTIAAFFEEWQGLFILPKGKRNEAKIAHGRFYDNDSDFITFLNIWKEYKNLNGARYRWAEANFLNAHALDTVRQTREQILNILKKKMSCEEYPADSDVIGKCVFAGLVSNLMYNTGSGGHNFVHAPNNSSHTMYIHQASSVYGSQTEFCVAGEAFKTTNQNGMSKTFVSPVQKVDSGWIVEVAPHLCEKMGETLVYDAERDLVHKHIGYSLKEGVLKVLPPVTEKADPDSETARVFAEFLAENPSLTDFTRKNRWVVDEYNKLCVRNGGTIPENPHFSGEFSNERLRDIYLMGLTHTGNASSLREVKKRNMNLSFSLNHFISKDVQHTILKENPDMITVGEEEYAVEYFKDSAANCRARISMSMESALRLDAVPSLPSGRKVYVLPSGAYFANAFNDIDTLKRNVRHRMNEDVWSKWRSGNHDVYFPLKNPDSSYADISLPEPVEYGRDALTDEPLIAYPSISFRESYFTRDVHLTKFYTRDKSEADKAYDESVDWIEKDRAKAEEKKNRADTLAALGKELNMYKEKMGGLSEKMPPRAVVTQDKIDEIRKDVNGFEFALSYKRIEDAEKIKNRLSDVFAGIEKRKQLLEESDTSIIKVAHNDLLKKVESALGIHTDIDSIRNGKVPVPSGTISRIDFSDADQVVLTEVVAKNQDGGTSLVSQIIIDKDGVVLFADDAERMIFGDDDTVWDGGIVSEADIESYDIFYSEEEMKKGKGGVSDDSDFSRMSLEKLKSEFSGTENKESREAIRKHLIAAYEVGIEESRNSGKSLRAAILVAELEGIKKTAAGA